MFRKLLTTSPFVPRRRIYLNDMKYSGFSTLENKKEICITTPIFYVNSQPHIGHLYTLILSDAFYRWKCIDNYDAFLETGTDEHGQKIQNSARLAQKDPQLFVDEVSQKFSSLAAQFGVKYDKFNRTSAVSHKEGAQHFWSVLEQKGFIQMKKYEGWYHTSDETFVAEKDLLKDANGKFVTQSGQSVDWVSEETHIFVLDKIRQQVIDYIESQKPVFPEHYNGSVLKQLEDIKDISISRPKSRLSWGIPVPSNEDYTIYVWLDALTNYLTGLGYPHQTPKIQLSNSLYHIMGKDILKFHAIFWPAFLLAAGYTPPQNILIHHHWIKDHQKMSKSLGNVVDPVVLGGKYGTDSVRLYFLAEGPQDFDSNFDEVDLTKTSNLFIEGFTNLMSRILNKKIVKDGKIQEITWILNEDEHEYIRKFQQKTNEIKQFFDNCDFRKGYINLAELWSLSNKLMTDKAPWQKDISEENKQKTGYLILESIRIISIFVYPILPEYIQRVYKVMNLNEKLINTEKLTFRVIDKDHPAKESFSFNQLSSESGFLQVDLEGKKLIFKTKFELAKPQ